MSYFSGAKQRYFAGVADRYFASDGIYRRADTEISLRLKRILPSNASVQSGRFRIDAQEVCFRFPAAALIIDGAEIIPTVGDEIIYEGARYLVGGNTLPVILGEGMGREWHINAAVCGEE